MPAATPTPVPLPIWLWFEYANNTPARYIQLNLQALQRHAPASHFTIHLVNRSIIAAHVPDLPDAFWKLPTRVAFSDAGRLALLATRGGIYLDADFLVLRSLVPVADLLQRFDIVGYPFSPPHGVAETSAACALSGRLSANFLAARPNATLFRVAWDTFRSMLARKCRKGRLRKIFVCCRDSDTGELLPKCRVPHATTDLMISRIRAGVMRQSPAARRLGGEAVNASMHCFGGPEDLTTPRLNPVEGVGRSLTSVLAIPLKDLRLCYGKWRLLGRLLGCESCSPGSTQVCCHRDGDDLECRSRGPGRGRVRATGFYAHSRLAYHLFDSFQRHTFLAQKRIEWSNLTVAPLYRRALGLPEDLRSRRSGVVRSGGGGTSNQA